MGLLGLPLIAVAIVAFALSVGHETSKPAAAAGPTMILTVKSGATTCPAEKTNADVCVGIGQGFTLSVDADNPPAAGYDAIGTYVSFGNALTYKKGSAAAEIVWPDCDFSPLSGQHDNDNDTVIDAVNHNCGTTFPAFPDSNFSGNLVELSMNCPATEVQVTVDLIPYLVDPAGTDGSVYGHDGGSTAIKPDSLNVSCVPAPTDTPTPTPPPIPRWFKAPALQNLFITGNLKPQRCDDATQVATFTEQLSQLPVGPDPKGFEDHQFIGSFSFDVRFDSKLVCVNIRPGPVATLNNMTCIIDDKDAGLQLDGEARLGCLTKGKPTTHDETSTILAYLDVRPQPEVLSQLKPDQDNGIAVQLLDQDCKLSDVQSHVIPIFSCEDADLTIRFLEGDVAQGGTSACAVDVLDQQMIAMRWGATKGSLVYNTKYDLEPSGFPSGGLHGDGDIDIRDLQFVFGRHGSTCTTQWPPQPPVNPKA